MFVFCLHDSVLPPLGKYTNIYLYLLQQRRLIYWKLLVLLLEYFTHSDQHQIQASLTRLYLVDTQKEKQKGVICFIKIIFKWTVSSKSEGFPFCSLSDELIKTWDLFIQNVNTWTCNTVSIFLLSDTATNIKMWGSSGWVALAW